MSGIGGGTGVGEAGEFSTAQEAWVSNNSALTTTDNAVVRFNGTGGNHQNSGVTIDDSNNLLIPSLTASEIVITDASKNLVSAAVATYPSLTELSYVKGVTSAIQTQFTAKAGTALSNLASVAINTTLVSDTDNTDALGTTAIAWSDLFLGSGAVITFNSAPSTADVTLTHAANALTIAGGSLTIADTGFLLSNAIGSLAGGTADIVTLGAYDLSAGNATLALGTETAVAADVAVASTHSLTVRINGASYKVLLTAI